MWETVLIIERGANYGYPVREGPQARSASGAEPLPEDDTLPVRISGTIERGTSTTTYPVIAYKTHVAGDAIAGGFIYSGSSLPALQNKLVMRSSVIKLPRSITSAVLLALLFMPVPPARAQEVERDTMAVIPLGPVVVTALRTPFVLAEVPYAVAVNSRAEIQRAKPGLGLDEALFGIPGVQVDNRYNYALGERISIRGFGARAQFGVRGVKVLLDGIPATFPDGQTALSNVDLGTLGRVEVLRGPASALYGNAAGGVVRFEMEAPPPRPLDQEFSVTAGANGLLRLQSTTGGRSGATSYLLNLSHLSYDGYRAFSTAENLHVNGRLAYTGERARWNLIGSFVSYDAQNPGSLSDSLLRADPSQAYRFNEVQQTGETGQQGQLGARWQQALRGGELELSAYALARRVDNPIPPVIIDLERAVGGLRALYRSPARAHEAGLQWTIGVEGDLQRDDRENYTNERGERGTLVLDQFERVWNGAAFAQLSANVAPRLGLLGGLRYDYFRFAADDRLIGEADPDDSGSRTMDAFSPSLGLTYSLAEALNLYANASTSFETPTTTELANRPTGAGGFNSELEPQRTRSVEVGSRGQLGGRMTYQLSAYRAGVENALVPFEVPDVPGRQFFRNTGSALHQGVEAGASWAPAEGVLVRLAYAYTDARFDEYSVDDVSYKGNRIPGVAPHHLQVGISYEARRSWFAALDTRYLSEVPVNDVNEAFAAAYTVVDGRLGFEGVHVGPSRVTAFVGVSNLFDERYSTSVVVNAFGGRYYEPGPPRALYVGAKLGLGWARDERP